MDRAWNTREHGVLVRYCNDLVVMCHSRQQAQAALAQLRALLAELGLEPKLAKTLCWISSASEYGSDGMGEFRSPIAQEEMIAFKAQYFESAGGMMAPGLKRG